MNHIAVRRFALTAASVSFSLLTALMLIAGTVYSEGLAVAVQSFGQAQPCCEESVQFPKTISCTSLTVESLSAYDGSFHEDGSAREVFNAAAILLRNTSDEMVPYVHVILRTKSTSYIFDGFMIPAGATVLIPEKNSLPFVRQEEIESCFGWATVMEQTKNYALSLEDLDMGTVSVTNLSGNEIRNLTLYHKTYLQESNMYVGGTAFDSRIDCIGPGETVFITPQYYASGYSKIVYWE